jgi:hypothetical protein
MASKMTDKRCFSCAEQAVTTAPDGNTCCADCAETEILNYNELLEQEAYEIYWEALQSFKSAEKLLNSARERLEKISTKNTTERLLKASPQIIADSDPKKGTESAHYCDQHHDDPLLHDGDGGLYCDTCDSETQHD